MRKLCIFFLLAGLILFPMVSTAQDDENRLILATTTSTQDSGLLDYLLPYFEDAYDVEVDVIAVGTGQALELGQNGDADVLLVHAKAREEAFVEEGYGMERFDVMYNDFILVGPADDPAEIADLETAADAFTAIADSETIFVSRGDDSGTHTKELSLWESTEITPEGDWYIEAGQGMGEVLLMSDEMQGYTLTDRATYVSMQENLSLEVLFEGDPALFNQYGVIAVNPEKYPDVNFEMAQAFVDWITSVEAQQLIADYQVNETQLFVPNSAQWLEANPPAESTPEATETPED